MPFVTDPEWLDRSPSWKKGPGSAHDRVLRIARETLCPQGLAAEAVTPDLRLDGLGIDSIETLGFVMALETEFGVPIPDRLAEALRTLGDVISHFEAPG